MRVKLFGIIIFLACLVSLGSIIINANDVDAIRFTASGDYGSGANTDAVLDQIGQQAPDFHLALGDLSYDSNSDPNQESDWCSYVTGRLSLQGMNTGTFPFQLVAGNHEDDVQRNGFIDDFAACLPDRMNSIGSYADHYYFDTSNVRVIMISPSLSVNGNSYDFETNSVEYQDVSDWVDEGRSGGADWIIVGIHRDCLTVGAKPTCEIGTNIMDLLVEKNVDLILHAHDHTYQRTEQLKLGVGCTSVAVNGFDSDCVGSEKPNNVYQKGAGPVDIITGAGGHSLYAVNNSDTEKGYFLKASGANNSPSYGNLVVDISGNELTAEFIAANGAYADKFIITDSNQYLVNDYDNDTRLVGDFNGDDKDDIAYVEQSNDVSVWRVAKSKGSYFGPSSRWSNDFGNNGDSFYVGDFNGDGKDDIAYWRASGDTIRWRVNVSTGRSFKYNGTWSSDFGDNSDSFYVGDFTGNGQDDIAYSRAVGDTISWHVAKSTGSNFASEIEWSSDAGDGNDRFFIGNFNRDSKVDIASMRPSDGTTVGWYVALSRGTYFESPKTWSTNTGDTDDTFRVGDFNGDNRDELVYIRAVNFYTNQIRRSLSDGSSFGSSNIWKSDFGNDGDRYRVGDFNGDNRDDLALARGLNPSTLLWKVGISRQSGFIDDGTWKSDFGNSESVF